MAVKFEHNGRFFEVETPEQAVTLLDLLDARAGASERHAAIARGVSEGLTRTGFFKPGAEAPNPIWDAELFTRFIDRLGDPQKIVLEFLIIRHTATDVELRAAIKASDNHVLAGVLSGISKQALAEQIDPRNVFFVQNLRSRGQRKNRYGVAECFLDIARESNWPANLRHDIFPELNKE